LGTESQIKEGRKNEENTFEPPGKTGHNIVKKNTYLLDSCLTHKLKHQGHL